MDMEDHINHQQYDLRQLVNGVRSTSTHFPSMPDDFFPGGHRNLTALVSNQNQHYDMMMLGRGIVLDDFAVAAASASTVATATPAATTTSPETLGCIGGGDTSTGRWPRQETLTLLEIRSRLDPKFKESNQKGPLWDEVSRIMSEEHGYQRSGKKCREKFENLYKYYKKTKEGKAGRHDGKHYRFFRQLEALYGDNSNQTTSSTVRNFQGPSQTNQDNMFYSHSHSHHNNLKHNSDSLSLTNSTDFDTSSSDHSNEAGNMESVEIKGKKRKSGRSWRVKIKDFIDSQVKKLVEKQEEWLDKLVKTMEEKEKERMLRDEEWRKQEAIRIEREHKFWAKERAWIEARDAALMETLHNIAGGREMKVGDEGLNVTRAEFQNNIQNEDEIKGADSWQETEVARLQQLRNEMETWEEVATKMACFGYQRTAFMCKKKWESINNCNSNYPRGSSKHKENSSRTCFYFNNNNDQSSMYNQGSSTYCDISDQRHQIGKLQRNDGSSPSNSNVAPGETCFPFLMSEGGNLWENFGLKINKSNQNH